MTVLVQSVSQGQQSKITVRQSFIQFGRACCGVHTADCVVDLAHTLGACVGKKVITYSHHNFVCAKKRVFVFYVFFPNITSVVRRIDDGWQQDRNYKNMIF